MTQMPRLLIYQCINQCHPSQKWRVIFYESTFDPFTKRTRAGTLPVQFLGESEDEAVFKATEWWSEETAKEEKAKADAAKRATDRQAETAARKAAPP